MNNDKYTFTAQQLRELLYGTIGMFQEYRDVHGKTEEQAVFHAASEMFDGLDAERELFEVGEVPFPTLQIMETK